MTDSISSVLSQIRAYQNQLGQVARVAGDAPRSDALGGPAALPGQPPAAARPSFGETLRGALEGVNAAQQRAGALAQAFERGEPGADLARVMVAAQQSQVAFRATVEVRNRLVQAYQDVMNMPL
ncbi:flagellar hook-basal body complex protein FliE [Pseudoxanthomonas sp. J35]|uniref:flagellar hook-basal body complex protein FliE n=1 Tax=Pseudoxanthomonas sp. J35 TaxID=935852 RepID=UPI00048C1E14|nr:flagellar hook-basal body complex protein FliE [Pseudoxanthomonas sp. J35]